jgi:outer membrane lipoprotein carrier protein
MWTETALVFFLTAGVSAAPAPAPTPAPAAAPAPKADAKLEAVVAGLQKAYEGTKDFSGKFTQRYTFTMLRRTQESKGEVHFERPGKMRWDYAAPNPKSFVVDGKSLWVHQPADHTAFVNPCFKQDGLTASVAFLWGSGNIKEQFDVAWFDGVFGQKSDHHLQLTPKQPNSIFAKLILVVDPKSHRVKQSVVVDAQGNVNQFIYEDVAFNKGQQQATFAFTPPAGTHVSNIPGACGDQQPAPPKAGDAATAP